MRTSEDPWVSPFDGHADVLSVGVALLMTQLDVDDIDCVGRNSRNQALIDYRRQCGVGLLNDSFCFEVHNLIAGLWVDDIDLYVSVLPCSDSAVKFGTAPLLTPRD